MKVAIYSPYLDTLGGGERYIATIAEIFSEQHSVDLLFDKHLQSFGMDTLKDRLSERFNLDLSKVNSIKAPVGKGSNFFSRMFFLRKYDLLFYLTDGSIFYPPSKKSILHIQTPLVGQPAKSLWGRFKLAFWNLIIYNSEFTRHHSKNNWPLVSCVIYPPVDTDKIKPLKKKKFILSVGRFFGFLKDKKHEILIKTFKELIKGGEIGGWSLHLVGSAGEGDQKYLNDLKNLAEGLPINFYPNLDYEKLVQLYGESSIYWHAAGFGEENPTKMEHFGISTVEAMVGGCVPVVIRLGGQTEIVENGKNGFLWSSLNELKEQTTLLVKDQHLCSKLSKKANLTSQRFSKNRFSSEIMKLVADL